MIACVAQNVPDWIHISKSIDRVENVVCHLVSHSVVCMYVFCFVLSEFERERECERVVVVVYSLH